MPPTPPHISLLQGASLFLDFDGTLVDIAARPDKVVVGERTDRLIALLATRLHGRLAILSGRSIDQLLAMLGTRQPLAIGGSHGLELRWADGRMQTIERPAELGRIAERMSSLQARYPGILVEEKPFGAALHYRGAPEAEEACRVLAVALAEETGLHLQPGKMVFEVHAGGANKGAALRRFMSEPSMAGTAPIFLGDDDTDEPGFAMAAAMGGAGILVGPARLTAACYRLADVTAALEWLEAASEVLA
jgi:trehalose 6-phosphate phosphatase